MRDTGIASSCSALPAELRWLAIATDADTHPCNRIYPAKRWLCVFQLNWTAALPVSGVEQFNAPQSPDSSDFSMCHPYTAGYAMAVLLMAFSAPCSWLNQYIIVCSQTDGVRVCDHGIFLNFCAFWCILRIILATMSTNKNADAQFANRQLHGVIMSAVAGPGLLCSIVLCSLYWTLNPLCAVLI